jgi:PKD repeat protein
MEKVMSTKYLVVLIAIWIVAVGVVSAEPPKCILLVKPTDGYAPLTVMASEESLDETIVDWKFNFGDGVIVTKSGKVEHTYDKAGQYTVDLGVLNDKGEESKDSVLVTVLAPPTQEPTPTPMPTKPPATNTASVVYAYEGSLPIKTAVESKSVQASVRDVLIEETDKVMTKVAFPYTIVVGDADNTEITISKYRCDTELSCGYWISATRDRQEVQVNSPIWIDTPPYLVEVSRATVATTADSVQTTITLKEDTKMAVEKTLVSYVSRQPLGKATVGTKG